LVEEALLADPSDPAVHALEGYIHDLSGRTEMAIVSYRATLFLAHSLFQVRLLLAEALRRLGRDERAAHEYREVLSALAAGPGSGLDAFAALPLASREQAARRCREALARRGYNSSL
jgi:hypothetical protein